MDINPDRRLALHAFGIPLVGAGLLFVFPTHPAIGWGLVGLGLSISAYAELKYRYPALPARLNRILPWRPTPAMPERVTAFVPLVEVAQELIDAAPTSRLMQYARSGAGPNPADILDWFGLWLIGRGLPIYGRRPPSTTFEPIAAEDLKSGMVDGGARVLRWQGADHLTFHDLAVRRSDLKARRSEFIAAVREGALS